MLSPISMAENQWVCLELYIYINYITLYNPTYNWIIGETPCSLLLKHNDIAGNIKGLRLRV